MTTSEIIELIGVIIAAIMAFAGGLNWLINYLKEPNLSPEVIITETDLRPYQTGYATYSFKVYVNVQNNSDNPAYSFNVLSLMLFYDGILLKEFNDLTVNNQAPITKEQQLKLSKNAVSVSLSIDKNIQITEENKAKCINNINLTYTMRVSYLNNNKKVIQKKYNSQNVKKNPPRIFWVG